MRSLYSFIISPKDKRYENTKRVGDTDLILNTEMQNHQFVSRIGVVKQTPINVKTGISIGDEVILHHNIFRRFYDIRGEEKNSSSYFNEDEYFVDPEQVYMYKKNGQWKPLDGYCFVKPMMNVDEYNTSSKQDLMGIIRYVDNGLKKNGIKLNDVVGFTKDSEYEFRIDGELLYRVPTDSICIKYGYQAKEEEYNRSWI